MMTIFSLSELSATPHEVWYNAYSGITISTEYHTNGMYVRGLYNKNRTTWFKRKSSSTFRDSRGNTILISSDKLIFTDRKRRSKLTFITLTAFNNQHSINSQPLSKSNPRMVDNRDYDTSLSNETTRNVNTVQNQGKLELVEENTSTSISLISLEGTWSVQNLDKKVYITETRDGLKARFTDSMNWVSYERISGTNDYINPEGEKYTRNQDNLIWHYSSGQKIFILTKISNDLVE